MKKQRILERLRAHQAELETMGIKHLMLFGSVARDEEGPDSDIDLAAEFNRPHQRVGLFQFSHIQDYLSHLLEQPVDLMTPEGLLPHVREGFEQERVLVF